MKEIKQNRSDENVLLKSKKTIFLIVILLIIGLLLLINPFDNNKGNATDQNQRMLEYTSEIEAKIASMCSMVKGASNVSVTVYFDSGFESIYAYNEEIKSTSNGSNSEKKYVTIGSGSDEKMVCIVEKMPNISGVAVVCVGGGNSVISSEIINLISSAFNVPKNKIYVAEGKK